MPKEEIDYSVCATEAFPTGDIQWKLMRPEPTRTGPYLAPESRVLREVSMKGDIGEVKRILREGADEEDTELLKGAVNGCNDSGTTALMWACHEDHLEIVKTLLEAGADIECISKSGDTCYTYAEKRDRTEIYAQLMETRKQRKKDKVKDPAKQEPEPERPEI